VRMAFGRLDGGGNSMACRGLLVVMFLTLAGAACGYRKGDLVQMSRKTIFGMESSWTQVISEYCPRFLYDKVVKLPTLSNSPDFPRSMKIMLGFDKSKFITPWITIREMNGDMLHFLEVSFVYSGNEIVDFRYRTSYYKPEATEPTSSEIYIYYFWEEVSEKSLTSGVAFLLCSTFTCACGLFALVGMDIQKQIHFMTKQAKKGIPSAPLSVAQNLTASAVPSVGSVGAPPPPTPNWDPSSPPPRAPARPPVGDPQTTSLGQPPPLPNDHWDKAD